MRKKNCARNLTIRNYAFFNIWKRVERKKCARNFRFVTMLFLILKKLEWAKELRQECHDSSVWFLTFEKGMNIDSAPGILRFVSMLFLMVEKGWEKKLGQEFNIRNYVFLKFEEGMRKKTCARNFKIGYYAFFNNKKIGMSKKIAPPMSWFLSVLFNIWKKDQHKQCARNFKIRKYVIFNGWKGLGKKLGQKL